MGYLADKDWSFVEFLCMMHASWRFIKLYGDPQRLQVDLLVFAHPRWASELSKICRPLGPADMHAERLPSDTSQCYSVVYPQPPPDVWHGYPFINNVHMFADPLFAGYLQRHYGYVMKTDFDSERT